MKLAPAQQSLFWRVWARVCEYQGWTRERGLTSEDIDARRRETLARCGFDSLRAVDRGRGFDRVLAELGRLRDNLERTAEVDNSDPGTRRRYLHKLAQDAATLGGMHYLLAIARDKFHVTSGLSTIEDLPTGQLRQLVVTLHARRHYRRQPAPASVPAECPF